MDGRRVEGLLRSLVALGTVGCILGFAAPALANAPNPIPGTTKVDGVSIANNQYTVTVEGQWNWVTQTSCPTARNGVGYNVAWFDPGDTANPIGGNNSPNGVIYVGSSTDNMVHSIETLGGSSVIGNAFYDGLPSSYLTHNTVDSTPTKTDANNWVSNCNNVDPSTKVSSGTWGPVSHTYPAGFTGPFVFCPVMYDPHGSGTTSGGKIGSSGVGDLTAGGNGHNNDNSYEGNGQGANGNNCAQTTITPGLTVQKLERIGNSGPFVHGPVYGQPGQTVNYQITVTNTGNFAETYTFSDPECDAGTLSGPSPAVSNGSLPAGQAVQYTCSHVITTSDTATGFTNTACATSGTLNPCDSTVLDVPAITLVKQERINGSGSFTHGPVTGNPGDTVNYKMTVTNSGSTALVLNFTDPNCDSGTLSGPSPALSNNTLAIGASVQYTCSHVLAAADAPSFTNAATVVGTAPDGTQVNGFDSVVANLQVTPGIRVTKLQRIGNTGPFTHNPVTGNPGDTVNYEMTVTNTGNVPLTAVAFSDQQCDAGTLSGPTVLSGSYDSATNTLSVNGAILYTCSHLVSASDAPSFTNSACAQGSGNNTQVSSCDHVVVPIPLISLLKQERINSTGSFTHGPVTGNVGDTVNYLMTVTNTGGTPLVLNFTDAKCDSGTLSGPSPSLSNNTLQIGEQVQYTCSHVLAAGDNPYTNTASVVGTAPDGTHLPAQDSVNAYAKVPGQPAFQVIKLQRDGTSGPFTQDPIEGLVGDTINYEIQVVNTGNTVLTLSPQDPGCDSTPQGPFPVSGTLVGSDLSPDGVAQYTCLHTLTPADGKAGFYTNVATVTGNPPGGPPIHHSGPPVTVYIPSLTAEKLASVLCSDVAQKSPQPQGVLPCTGTSTPFVPDSAGRIAVLVPASGSFSIPVSYQIRVTNTSQTPLVLSVNDPRCESTPVLHNVSGLSGTTLAPNGQAYYTCTHTLTRNDPGTFTNTATVTGTPPNGPSVQVTTHVTTIEVSGFGHTCRSLRTGRLIHYKGKHRPKACKPQPGPHGGGFTG